MTEPKDQKKQTKETQPAEPKEKKEKVVYNPKALAGARCGFCNGIVDSRHIYGYPKLVDKDLRTFEIWYRCAGDGYITIRVQAA